jgi:hypothetical protein
VKDCGREGGGRGRRREEDVYVGRVVVVVGPGVAPLFYVYKTLSAGVELHRAFSPVSINHRVFMETRE